MSEIQFAFNPVPSDPSGGGKFPWLWVLLAIGVIALVAKELHDINKVSRQKTTSNTEAEGPSVNSTL